MHENTRVQAEPERVGVLTHRSFHLGDTSFPDRLHKHWWYVSLSRPQTVRWYHFFLEPTKKAIRTYTLQGAWRAGAPGLLFSIYRFTSSVHYLIAAWERQRAPRRDELQKDFRDSDNAS
jgi:hypothetical protein